MKLKTLLVYSFVALVALSECAKEAVEVSEDEEIIQTGKITNKELLAVLASQDVDLERGADGAADVATPRNREIIRGGALFARVEAQIAGWYTIFLQPDHFVLRWQ